MDFKYTHPDPTNAQRGETKVMFSPEETDKYEELVNLLPNSPIPYAASKFPDVVLIGIYPRRILKMLLRGEDITENVERANLPASPIVTTKHLPKEEELSTQEKYL